MKSSPGKPVKKWLKSSRKQNLSRKLRQIKKKIQMPTLEEIKKKKLEELMRLQQEKLQQQAQEQAHMQQQIGYVEEKVRQFFTKESLERYGNLKAAHAEKAVQLLHMGL